MPTIKQRRAAKKLLENPRSLKEVMIESGYSPVTALHPKDLTESKGFKEAMAECGLTEELVSKSLVDDIKAKPKNRVGELKLAAKILRMENQGEGEQPITVINVERQKEIEAALEK